MNLRPTRLLRNIFYWQQFSRDGSRVAHFCCCDKIPEIIILKEEIFIVSVHVHLDLWQGITSWWEQSGGSVFTLQCSGPYFLKVPPPAKDSATSSKFYHSMVTKSLTHGPLEDTLNPNYNSYWSLNLPCTPHSLKKWIYRNRFCS